LIIIDTSTILRQTTPVPDAALTIDAGGVGSQVRGLIFNQDLTFDNSTPPQPTNGVTSAILLGSSPNSDVHTIIAGNIIGFSPFPIPPVGSPTNTKHGFDPGITILNSNNNIIGDPASPPNAIAGNTGISILIEGTSTGNLVQNTYIGTDATGTTAVGNTGPGIVIDGASSNTVGGSSAQGRNVISANANGLGGLVLRNGASNNLIQNSYIGTDVTGTTTLLFGNGGPGVTIDGTPARGSTTPASGNSVGGTISGLFNVISGNSGGGVVIQNGALQNVIQNSYIGIDATGKKALGNIGPGVTINASGTTAKGNSVGGTVTGGTGPGLFNVISGNQGDGVLIHGGSQDNVVQNSYIGLDASGTALITFTLGTPPQTFRGNTEDGIAILGSSNNTVGAVSGPVNVISGNTGNGILVTTERNSDTEVTTRSATTTIMNSYIGTAFTGANGATTLGNQGDGIRITDSDNTDVGFYSDANGDHGPGNVVSANLNGIHVTGTSSTTRIEFNSIGTDSNGAFAIGNSGYGIFLDHVQPATATATTTIGGTTAGSGNLISGNFSGGVRIEGSGGDLIQNNKIGPDSKGTADLGNGYGVSGTGHGGGVELVDSSNDTVGGTATGAGNTISFNAGAGILIQRTPQGASVVGTNRVQGNTITFNAGNPTTLPDLTVPNSGYGATQATQDYSGVMIIDASNNTIGGTAAGAGNTITGNTGNGILIADTTTSQLLANSNWIQGNEIGTSIAGQTGNLGDGVRLYHTRNNTVGGTVTGAANTISGNGSDGVLVFFDSAIPQTNTIADNLISRNTKNGIHAIGDLTANTLQLQILGNLIGTNRDGSDTYVGGLPQGNGLDGILLEQSATLPGTVAGTAVFISGNVSSDNGLSGIDVKAWQSGASFLARVSITNNELGTNKSGSGVSSIPSGSTLPLPFGNALDGIRLDGVVNVTIGGTSFTTQNVISGNLGRGIEIRGGPAVLNQPYNNQIGFNLIGTDSTGRSSLDQNGVSFGNLADGIFLLNPGATDILGNVVANNKGAGIHAANDTPTSVDAGGHPQFSNGLITIEGDSIGIGLADPATGASPILGNISDGVFFDNIVRGNTFSGAVRGSADIPISNNVISGNHANGIDLVSTSGVVIQGNKIGTNPAGNQEFSNAANGIFINQSNFITIGDTAAPGAGTLTDKSNIISGNHAYGVFVSGTQSTAAQGNLIEGNYIGLNGAGSGPISNAVAGIILSNASGDAISSNVISGNQLNGILLVNNAQNNMIAGNFIGTDVAGTAPVPNSADGVFLIGSSEVTAPGVAPNPTPSTISGNVIAGNVIAGNNQNGIHIFGGAGSAIGAGSINNSVTGNMIGLGRNGAKLGNGANGVLMDDAGPGNVIGGPTATPGTGPGNIISGNAQSGISISDTLGRTTATTIQGNLIGTDTNDNPGIGNGSFGVLIFGSSGNLVGGSTTNSGSGQPGTGAGNVISGNAQAGVFIFTPAPSAAANANSVQGNLIGTNRDGTARLGNGSEGVEIVNGSGNLIGGATSDLRNVISGNADNGVFINQLSGPSLSTRSNQVFSNYIGTNRAGTAAVGNLGNGVLIIDATQTLIGNAPTSTSLGRVGGTEVPTPMAGGAGNLISGNVQWGIQIELTGTPRSTNTVQGNYIGTDATGLTAIANGLGGVLVNDLSTQSSNPIPQMIGGPNPGAGNLISGNAGIGIELLGPQVGVTGSNNVVAGNLIGLSSAGAALGNGTGILISNSPNNLIGGLTPRPGTGPGNVVSGNGIDGSGIQVFGDLSTGNSILGNAIGTSVTGDGFPAGETEASLAQGMGQGIGVLINGASKNFVGGMDAGASNVLSGNVIGVEIAGIKQNTGQIRGGGNTVQGNLIGTDASGTVPVSNLDLGVYINNSQQNTIGPGNVIAANGIAGVEIFNNNSTRNLVAGNVIGLGSDGRRFPPLTASKTLISFSPEPGIPVFASAQLNGVVILGAPQNTVGLLSHPSSGQANTISGNVEVGVYITSRDFGGRGFSVPLNNVVSGNTIQNDGIYGVLFFDAPNNTVRPFTSQNRHLVQNKFGRNKINFRNFLSGFDIRTRLNKGSKPRGNDRHAAAHAAHPKVVQSSHVPVRPRVPALFHSAGPQGQWQVHPAILGALPPRAHTHRQGGR
jgi:parallel beta-helix repeat protein